MNLSPRVRFSIHVTATVLIVAAAILAPFTCFVKESSLPQLLKISLQSAPTSTAMWVLPESPGTLYARSLPDGGNIALHFEGFSPDIKPHSNFVDAAYCQGAAQFFPRRVVATEPGTIVNSGRDVLVKSFVPKISPLQAQDVRIVLNFSNIQNKIEVRSIPIPPPPPASPVGGPR